MKFTKQISIFLAIFILISNIGYSFNVNFCCGKVKSIAITTPYSYQTDNKKCCGEYKNENHCCKSNKIYLKTKADGFVSGFLFLTLGFSQNSILKFEKRYFSNNYSQNQSIKQYCYTPKIPRLYKLYHQLIFYA